MKVSYFYLLLSLMAMAIIGYLAFYIANSNHDEHDIVVGIGTAISVLLTLGAGMGLSHENSKMNVNMKVMCFLSFVLLMAVNFCFAVFGVSMPYYVIVVGLLLIAVAGLLKKMTDIKEV